DDEELRRGPGQRREEADHGGLRHGSGRHRISRGPGGDAVPPDRGPDRTPAHPQARPPQPPGSAPAGRPPPPAAAIPREDRHHPLPVADRATGSAPVAPRGEWPPSHSPSSYGGRRTGPEFRAGTPA